jgi:uncharacterized UBP type Zn finger protein
VTSTRDPHERCEHFASVGDPPPTTKGCAECTALGEKWIALRVCLTCGHVGCCEDSPHAHALAHFAATAHPIIRPLRRTERWTWCYVHHRYYAAVASAEAAVADDTSRVARWLKRWVDKRET